MFNISARVIGKEIVDAKLLMAAPRILEQNKLMIRAMLDLVKEQATAETPMGPGHFGYHLREVFTVDTKFEGIRTIGVLKSPPTGYWREFGTKGHFIHTKSVLHYMQAISGTMGERAFMTAHKALGLARRLVNFYYGGMANWWRS